MTKFPHSKQTIPVAMGMHCDMIKGKGPTFPHPLTSIDKIKDLELKPDVEKTLGYVFDTIYWTRQRVEKQVGFLDLLNLFCC